MSIINDLDDIIGIFFVSLSRLGTYVAFGLTLFVILILLILFLALIYVCLFVHPTVFEVFF